MAPARRRKLSTTPPLPPPLPDTTFYSIVEQCHSQKLVLTATPRQLSPTKLQTTVHSRLHSPIRKMATVGPTAIQKQQLIDNLKLECMAVSYPFLPSAVWHLCLVLSCNS